MNTMRVEDFVVLGRTVPEDSRKYGQKVCMAGYSAENNQFLRVYPLLVPIGSNADSNGFRARHKYCLELQRNPKDSRTESWRVADENAPTSTPWHQAIETKKLAVLDWLKKRTVPTIRTLNECKMSIGVMRVSAGEWSGVMLPRGSQEEKDSVQSLFDDLDDQAHYTGQERLISKVKHAPYIHFSDAEGKHKFQIREWGAYMLLAKDEYADKPEALWGASGYRATKDLYLVIGNMMNHRKNWLVIKTFEADDAENSPSLLDGIEDDQQS